MGRTLRVALLYLAAAAAQQCGRDPDAPFCAKDELCCQDSPTCKGACTECCIAQTDICVLPRGDFMTSTCCPKWTVGCTIGSVGCCDPAMPWQDGLDGLDSRSVRTWRKAVPKVGGVEAEAAEEPAGPTAEEPRAGQAYAIFTDSFDDKLTAYSFGTDGTVSSKAVLSGPFADYYTKYYGEATRILPWAQPMARFVFADADVLDAALPLTLYTINPADGSSASLPIKGCAGYPVGMAFDADTEKLMLGLQSKAHATYCAVDAKTGAATQLGSLDRGSSEANSTNFYGAYLSHASGSSVFRVGHRLVSSGAEPGISTVGLSASAAPSASWTALARPAGHGEPLDVSKHPTQAGFISMVRELIYQMALLPGGQLAGSIPMPRRRSRAST